MPLLFYYSHMEGERTKHMSKLIAFCWTRRTGNTTMGHLVGGLGHRYLYMLMGSVYF